MTFDPTITLNTIFGAMNFLLVALVAWGAFKVFKTRTEMSIAQLTAVAADHVKQLEQVATALREAQNQQAAQHHRMIAELAQAHKDHEKQDQQMFDTISRRMTEIVASVERLIGLDLGRQQTRHGA